MEATTVPGALGSRWSRIRSGLTREQWKAIGWMSVVILGLHAIGFFLLFTVVAPGHFNIGESGIFSVGVGELGKTFNQEVALGHAESRHVQIEVDLEVFQIVEQKTENLVIE